MKHIIFDFDGTLADSTAVFASAWNNTLAQKYKFKGNGLKEIDTLKNYQFQNAVNYSILPMYKLPMILPHFINCIVNH